MVVNLSGSNTSMQTAAELIAAAKARPGQLTYAYSSASTQLAAALFEQVAGVQSRGIPYKASSAGLTDVVSGIVDLFFIDDVSAAPFDQNDRLKPLAVSTPQRVPTLSKVPSATEIGVPNYIIQPWFVVFVSAKRPAPVVAQLRDQMTRAMKSPAAAANLENRGLSPLLVCGDELTKLQSDEMQLWKGAMRKAGIEAQWSSLTSWPGPRPTPPEDFGAVVRGLLWSTPLHAAI